MNSHFTWYFLSFKGRISRQEFWLGYVGLIVIMAVLRRPLQDFGFYWLQPTGRAWHRDELVLALYWPLLVVAMILLWPVCAIYAKRLHDLNFSGWWVAALPLVSMIENDAGLDRWNAITLAVVAIFGLIPGNRGSNRFGDDPLAPT